MAVICSGFWTCRIDPCSPSSTKMSDSENRVSKRGIPAVVFVEDVEAFLKSEGDISVEEAVKKFEESYKKYKIVESGILQERARMNSKIPELRNSLELISALEEKKNTGESFSTTYQLSEQVYGKAEVSQPDTVCLWLGANVMLEYPLEEARGVLQRNLTMAENAAVELTNELHFIKDQITATEVNMAYVFNYGVHQRKTMASSIGTGGGGK